MDPSRNYPQPVHSSRQCRPSRRCVVCSRQPVQILQEFFGMVRGSWSTAEMDILSKAARSALLLPAADGEPGAGGCRALHADAAGPQRRAGRVSAAGTVHSAPGMGRG